MSPTNHRARNTTLRDGNRTLMRLDLNTTVVTDMRFGNTSRFVGGVLEIDRDELRKVILEDPAFADVTLDIVRPGDNVRIIHVMDAVEPRWKPDPESTFPNYVGAPKTVGQGVTHRLQGV